jgi:hypothetical protein
MVELEPRFRAAWLGFLRQKALANPEAAAAGLFKHLGCPVGSRPPRP